MVESQHCGRWRAVYTSGAAKRDGGGSEQREKWSVVYCWTVTERLREAVVMRVEFREVERGATEWRTKRSATGAAESGAVQEMHDWVESESRG